MLTRFLSPLAAADCFVGLLDVATAGLEDSVDGVDRKEECSIESVRKERDWKECVLGMFCAFAFFSALFLSFRVD